MQEWLNWLVSKTSVSATVPRVRIPPLPPSHKWYHRSMQFVIALIIAVGVGIWVYGKIARSTGNNVKSASIVAGVAGLGVFFVIFFIARAFLPS